MPYKHNRREFLKGAAAGMGFWVAGRPGWVQAKSVQEKLNVACVGVEIADRANRSSKSSSNIVQGL